MLIRFSCVPLFDPWIGAVQAPLSVGFSRQEYWSGLPCPPPGDLPDSGLKPRSPALQVDSFPLVGFPVAQRVKKLPAMQETQV